MSVEGRYGVAVQLRSFLFAQNWASAQLSREKKSLLLRKFREINRKKNKLGNLSEKISKMDSDGNRSVSDSNESLESFVEIEQTFGRSAQFDFPKVRFFRN